MNRVLTPPPDSRRPLPENVPLSIAAEGTESPPQKKPKIDEEETSSDGIAVFSDEDVDTSSPIEPLFSQYDSEEDYCTSYPGKMDKALWDKYYQQVKESEGFDITDYPGQCPMTTVYPMPNYLNNPENADRMRDLARKALKHYNDSKGTNYKVNDVLKVNGGGCRDFIYYLTVSVETDDGKDDIFQAKVVEGIDYSLQFPTVRPKPKKGSQ